MAPSLSATSCTGKKSLVSQLAIRSQVDGRFALRKISQFWAADLIVTEWRVGSDVDVLRLAEFDKLVLEQQRVSLDLVDSWNDSGGIDDVGQSLNAEVGHSNSSNLHDFWC